MDMLIALGVSIGVLIAIWTYIAGLPAVALPVWAGIVAWGTFYAAGGKTEGLIKTVASNLSGVFWAFVALFVATRLGGSLAVVSLMVGVIAFAMCVQAKIPQLAFIPGAFLGAATTVAVVVAAKDTYVHAIIALVAGAIFGYVSEMVAGMLAAKKPAPAPAGDD